ncbi:cation transporter [Cohnella sp. REN36]|uniref:cation transporter n=1 Tax=Cohnella sp. REN36 TaxID=2887347 RepID=UPI001D147F0D|nr:cation transporter [Cohnella sp. REN36]MCC3375268.1 cation transporter [Cohnella sp. REN36]
MTNTTLKVEGMSCGHCVNSIEGALRELGASGKVNLSGGTVDVAYDESKLSMADIQAAIEEQGYELV